MLSVAYPNAVARPEAVVITSEDAVAAHIAVVGSGRLHLVTLRAHFETAKGW